MAASGRKHGRPGSLQIPPLILKSPAPAHHNGPSNISTFLTNLRMLELDLREDWPDIALSTFSTTDPQQNQKKRIQCAEWALYNLYLSWDEEETRTKLSPFFPPLDHLQSLHFRAALHRSLDRAKKDGALGRHVVLRRTMLDECKGEQFEEFLSTFSSVVLKDRVRRGHLGHDTIAQRLALDKLSYKSDRTTLQPLVLAYKSSLANTLAEKSRLRRSYSTFATALSSQEDEFQTRQEQFTASINESADQFNLTVGQVSSVREASRAFWTGSDAWFETLISGDSNARINGFLNTSFQETWARVESGQCADLQGQYRAGLLEQLNSRITKQRQRLTRWQEYEKTLKPRYETARKSKTSVPFAKDHDQAFRFTAHVSPQYSNDPGTKSTDVQPLDQEYTDFVTRLNEQLANISRPLTRRGTTKPELDQTGTADLGPELDGRRIINKNNAMQDNLSQFNHMANTTRHSTAENITENFEALAIQNSSMPEDGSQSSQHKSRLPREERNDDLTEAVPLSTYTEVVPSSPPASPIAASPGLVKLHASPSAERHHVLTLPERTRLSMFSPSERHERSERVAKKMNDYDRSLFSPADAHTIPSTTDPPRSIVPVKEATVQPQPSSATSDLAARTRSSMSNNAAIAKAVQLERRQSVKIAARAKRVSHMPAVTQSPYGKDMGDMRDTGGRLNAVKQQHLIADVEADYESVFMSRPKVKCSPPLSPVKTWKEVCGIVEEDDGETR